MWRSILKLGLAYVIDGLARVERKLEKEEPEEPTFGSPSSSVSDEAREMVAFTEPMRIVVATEQPLSGSIADRVEKARRKL